MSLITNDAIMQHFGYPGAVNDKVRAFFNTWYQGSGSPEGVVSAAVGSFYLDTLNGALYAKQSGSAATGWVAGISSGESTFAPAPSGDVTGALDDAAIVPLLLSGAEVILGAGTYYTATGWTIPSNCHLRGRGTSATIISAATANLVNPVSSTGTTKPWVQDLAVTTAGDNTKVMVYFDGCTDPIAENVKAGAGRWGIEAHDCVRPKINRCEATGQSGAAIPVGIYIAGTSSRALVTANLVHDTSGLGIFFDSTTSTQTLLGHRCANNHVFSVTDNGIRFQTNIAQTLQGFYTVTGNLVEDPGVDCIRVNGYGASITGNVCKNGHAGIRDTGAGSTVLTRSVVSGNTCISTVAYSNGGIEFHGSTTSSVADLDGTTNGLTNVTNTSFWAVGAPIGGVGIPAGTTVTARDTVANTLTLSAATTIAGTAVALTSVGSSDIAITGNYIEGYNVGINWSGTKGTITGNACRLNNGPGIWSQGLGEDTIIGNDCRNNDIGGAGRGGIELASTSVHNVITGNRCTDDQTVKTQNYGIRITTGSDFNTITGNDVTGNKTTNLSWQTVNSDQAFNNSGATLPNPQPSRSLSDNQRTTGWMTTGAFAETFPRRLASSAALSAPTSGTMRMIGGLVLPGGRAVSTVGVLSGTTPGSSITHSFIALFDASTLALLATSVDDTTAAWGAQTVRTFTLATALRGSTPGGTYTPTIEKAVYVGLVVIHAGAAPTLSGFGTNGVPSGLGLKFLADSTAGITALADIPDPAAALGTTITGMVYAYVS